MNEQVRAARMALLALKSALRAEYGADADMELMLEALHSAAVVKLLVALEQHGYDRAHTEITIPGVAHYRDKPGVYFERPARRDRADAVVLDTIEQPDTDSVRHPSDRPTKPSPKR